MPLTGFDHNVQWHEFRELEQRPVNTSEDAEIQIDYRPLYDYSVPPNGRCSVAHVNTNISVNTGGSWVVKDKKVDDLLKHEQGHFDIAALGAREIHQRISSLVVDDCSQISIEYNRISQEVQRLIDQTNIRYDLQTNHSRNTVVQTTWDNSIRSAKQSPTGTLSNLPQ